MATGALLFIDRLRGSRGRRGWHQTEHPGHLVRVDIEEAALRIPRAATPLCAAIEPRKDYGAFGAWRNKLSGATQRTELRDHGIVRRSRPCRRDFRAEHLTRKPRRPER